MLSIMKIALKNEAILLRKEGYSLGEIKEKVPVSKGTLSLWLRNIVLPEEAQKKIDSKKTNGQIASRKAKLAQTALREKEAESLAETMLNTINLGNAEIKLMCAMIYYCEGIKNVRDGVVFTNSDPGMIGLFLALFRKSFVLEEKKFRVCVHLHSYHDKDKQLNFWSKTSSIPVQQFIKPYQKPHSGLYKKEGYQGCVSVRYGNVRIAREMKAIAVQFMEKGL